MALSPTRAGAHMNVRDIVAQGLAIARGMLT